MIPSTFADYLKFTKSLHGMAEDLQKSEEFREIMRSQRAKYSFRSTSD